MADISHAARPSRPPEVLTWIQSVRRTRALVSRARRFPCGRRFPYGRRFNPWPASARPRCAHRRTR
ncbi:hypothetical protein [Streptomyces sp. NPDC058466]|uniref:hypothetical protein n=1 Tax=unclassified Streptomyces TaxID=2593676 RepID=UPI00364FA5C2